MLIEMDAAYTPLVVTNCVFNHILKIIEHSAQQVRVKFFAI